MNDTIFFRFSIDKHKKFVRENFPQEILSRSLDFLTVGKFLLEYGTVQKLSTQ